MEKDLFCLKASQLTNGATTSLQWHIWDLEPIWDTLLAKMVEDTFWGMSRMLETMLRKSTKSVYTEPMLGKLPILPSY